MLRRAHEVRGSEQFVGVSGPSGCAGASIVKGTRTRPSSLEVRFIRAAVFGEGHGGVLLEALVSVGREVCPKLSHAFIDVSRCMAKSRGFFRRHGFVESTTNKTGDVLRFAFG